MGATLQRNALLADFDTSACRSHPRQHVGTLQYKEALNLVGVLVRVAVQTGTLPVVSPARWDDSGRTVSGFKTSGLDLTVRSVVSSYLSFCGI